MVDKVTKMAAELIFSVDAHISLMHSGGKPYECDQCKYSSKMAQNLKSHKQTHIGEKPYDFDQCKYSAIFFHISSGSQKILAYASWRKALSQ